MSFNPIMARTIAALTPSLPDEPTVLEFGNQTINLPDDFRVPGGIAKPSKINGQSAEVFYRGLDYSTYDCLDVNENHGAILYNLNERHNTIIVRKYDLVTNNGTGEHCFNQDAIFFNAHQFCKVGAIMLHILPFINWINHGFYSFHPTLFVDLARANKYEIVLFSLANRWGFESSIVSFPIMNKTKEVKPVNDNSLLRNAIRNVAADEKRRSGAEFPNVMIVCAMKKTQDSEFIQPTQGKYLKDVSEKLPEVDHA